MTANNDQLMINSTGADESINFDNPTSRIFDWK